MCVAQLEARHLTGPAGEEHGPARERVVDVRAARLSPSAGLHGAAIVHNVIGTGNHAVPCS